MRACREIGIPGHNARERERETLQLHTCIIQQWHDMRPCDMARTMTTWHNVAHCKGPITPQRNGLLSYQAQCKTTLNCTTPSYTALSQAMPSYVTWRYRTWQHTTHWRKYVILYIRRRQRFHRDTQRHTLSHTHTHTQIRLPSNTARSARRCREAACSRSSIV